MSQPATEHATVVLVGGHESANGADLAFIRHNDPDIIITEAGRPLHNVVTRLIPAAEGPIVVIPMTFGRNPTFVADTAKTLKWLTARTEGRLVLADAFGSLDHLTAWLRTAAIKVRKGEPEAALVISARAANPFDDAELYRVAHLVRTHGAGNVVEVSVMETAADMQAVLQRLRLLGSDRAVVVPAGFQRESSIAFGRDGFEGSRFYGPLMSGQAVLRVIRERTRDALHGLGHGRTGIDAGLQADHGYGYAHSHAFEESQGNGHSHSGAGGHSHSHGHSQSPGQEHPHDGDGQSRSQSALTHMH